jgi:hypothetical protein
MKESYVEGPTSHGGPEFTLNPVVFSEQTDPRPHKNKLDGLGYRRSADETTNTVLIARSTLR